MVETAGDGNEASVFPGCKRATICYNAFSMTQTALPIDISNNPELVRIAEEVRTTKTPRVLKKDNETVAVLVPAEPTKKQQWEHIRETFGSWNDVDADAMISNIYRAREEGSRPPTRPE